ncbi:MAG: CopG family transcriptional regulator [Thermodesulfobacteriota bacterium]|nr:CopG family transcriptional regulator [Thermodesulfobacteriota bacterium]
MKGKKLAISSAEFDRRFDSGEDIHDLIDMSKATVIRQGKKVRITLDVAESLVRDIDEIRKRIGVDRGALIKVWLHEKVKQEKAVASPKESTG